LLSTAPSYADTNAQQRQINHSINATAQSPDDIRAQTTSSTPVWVSAVSSTPVSHLHPGCIRCSTTLHRQSPRMMFSADSCRDARPCCQSSTVKCHPSKTTPLMTGHTHTHTHTHALSHT
jgi:hypothetical protein